MLPSSSKIWNMISHYYSTNIWVVKVRLTIASCISNFCLKGRNDTQHNDIQHKGLLATPSIYDTQHNNTLYQVPLCWVWISFFVILNVIILRVVVPNTQLGKKYFPRSNSLAYYGKGQEPRKFYIICPCVDSRLDQLVLDDDVLYESFSNLKNH